MRRFSYALVFGACKGPLQPKINLISGAVTAPLLETLITFSGNDIETMGRISAIFAHLYSEKKRHGTGRMTSVGLFIAGIALTASFLARSHQSSIVIVSQHGMHEKQMICISLLDGVVTCYHVFVTTDRFERAGSLSQDRKNPLKTWCF